LSKTRVILLVNRARNIPPTGPATHGKNYRRILVQLKTAFRPKLYLLPLLILTLFAGRAQAQSAEPTLGGLKGVEIVLELKHETKSRLGLTFERAYKAVEEEIRKAGVRVLPPTEQAMQIGSSFRKLPQGYAVLYFQVVTVVGPGRGDNYAVDLRFDLLDRVRLSRDNSTETIASVYNAHQLFLSTGRGGDEDALRALRAMAREFAADFMASNPETDRR
jgi:hypothetical protein